MEETQDRVGYWKNKWENNEAPWHYKKVNEYLEKYVKEMIPDGSSSKRVFVPLCGKSLDLKWLYDMGHHVVGLDAVEKAIKEFFEEQNLPFEESNTPEGGHYFQTPDARLKIFCSDLFSISPEVLGKFDGVWDRGSLVAIYIEDRERYAVLLKQVLGENFRYLVDTMVYDQTKFSGPPRSVPVEEIMKLFGDVATVRVLEEVDRNKGPEERTPRFRWNLETCHEVIVLLTPKL